MATAIDKEIKKLALEYRDAKTETERKVILAKVYSDDFKQQTRLTDNQLAFLQTAIAEFDKPIKQQRKLMRLIRKTVPFDVQAIEEGIELEKQRKAGDKSIKKVNLRPKDLIQDNARLTSHIARRFWDRSKQGLENTALLAQEAIMETKLATKDACLGMVEGVKALYDTAENALDTMRFGTEIASENFKKQEMKNKDIETRVKDNAMEERNRFEDVKKMVKIAQEARKDEANETFMNKVKLDAEKRARDNGTTLEQEILKTIKRTSLRSWYFLSNARVALKQAKYNVNQKEVEQAYMDTVKNAAETVKIIDDEKIDLDTKLQITTNVVDGINTAIADVVDAKDLDNDPTFNLDNKNELKVVDESEKSFDEAAEEIEKGSPLNKVLK